MPAVSDTRQKALNAALELFSRKGYEATSMGDIAGALGIKAPSLYKYFKGKEDLYAALAPMLEDHYTALWADLALAQDQLEQSVALAGVLTADQLESETMAWLRPELEDAQARCLRRLMTLEQFAGNGPDRWLWTRPLALYEGFFERLISREVLRRGDPHVMAVQYLAPLVQYLAIMDRDPDRADDCLTEISRHIRQFHRVFAHREPRASGPQRLFRR